MKGILPAWRKGNKSRVKGRKEHKRMTFDAGKAKKGGKGEKRWRRGNVERGSTTEPFSYISVSKDRCLVSPFGAMSSLANPASHSLGPDIPMFPKKGARPMTSAPFSCEAVSAPLSFIPPKFTVASTLALSAAVVYFSRSPSAVSKLWQELSCSCSRNLPLWFGEELLLGERGLGRRGGCAVVVRCSEEWGEGAGNGLRRHFSTADRARVTKSRG